MDLTDGQKQIFDKFTQTDEHVMFLMNPFHGMTQGLLKIAEKCLSEKKQVAYVCESMRDCYQAFDGFKTQFKSKLENFVWCESTRTGVSDDVRTRIQFSYMNKVWTTARGLECEIIIFDNATMSKNFFFELMVPVVIHGNARIVLGMSTVQENWCTFFMKKFSLKAKQETPMGRSLPAYMLEKSPHFFTLEDFCSGHEMLS